MVFTIKAHTYTIYYYYLSEAYQKKTYLTNNSMILTFDYLYFCLNLYPVHTFYA